MTFTRQYLPVLLAGLLTVGGSAFVPAPAAAQGFISPFIGFNYGGDSGCPRATGCEDNHSNIGVSGGKLGSVGGGEVELGYARNFFGDSPDAESNVLTLMGNVLIGPRLGPVRPYFLIGMGLIKTHVEFTTGSILDSANNFGWDMGGGLIVMFGGHVGVRGDVRRFQSFQETNLLGIVDLSSEKLSFNRATIGAVFAW